MSLAMKQHQASTSASRKVAGRRTVAPSVRRCVRVAATTSQDKLESRWADQIKEGRVVNVSNTDLNQMMQQGWTLLDVRAPHEANKVPVIGAIQVPLFQAKEGMDLATLLSKWAYLGTGGWWLGGTHMEPNPGFMQEVQAKIPKDAKVVVACQKGLRSLAACEQLSRAGYKGGLAWVNGGLDTCRKGDVATPDDMDIRYAGIGGFSEMLGWTEVQQEEKKELFGGANGVLSVFAVILAADLLLFAYESVVAMQNGTIPPAAPM